MLQEGLRKLQRLGLGQRIRLVAGEAEALPVPSNHFHSATIGFGLRNVTSIDETFAEMARAVVPGGKVVALEIAKPQNPVLRPFFFLTFTTSHRGWRDCSAVTRRPISTSPTP
jgi:demethylmenaquinone methyltransferase/2-methoxy-6-polyprenyl-1,4-benzoquinol methylase